MVDMGARTLMSFAEFEKSPDDGNLHELDEGELIVMPQPTSRQGLVQSAITEVLRQAARKSGRVVLTETGFRIAPDTVRAPDVAVVRQERRGEINWNGYSDFRPDLAVEILSPDDVASRVQRKITNHLSAGSTAVRLVDPENVTITVYHRSGTFQTLSATDRINIPELLGDFSVEVRSLFE